MTADELNAVNRILDNLANQLSLKYSDKKASGLIAKIRSNSEFPDILEKFIAHDKKDAFIYSLFAQNVLEKQAFSEIEEKLLGKEHVLKRVANERDSLKNQLDEANKKIIAYEAQLQF